MMVLREEFHQFIRVFHVALFRIGEKFVERFQGILFIDDFLREKKMQESSGVFHCKREILPRFHEQLPFQKCILNYCNV